MPAIEGKNITARRMQQDPQQYQLIKAKFEKTKSKLRDGLMAKLPALFAARIKITASNVFNDHTGKVKLKARGHDEPLPTEDKIRTAASMQAQDVVEILTERFTDI